MFAPLRGADPYARYYEAPPDREENLKLKTSLGIWALGPMITRFVPEGYQPEHTNEPTAAKVRRAVEGLGDLLREAQSRKDAVRAYELVYAALGA